MGDVEQLPFPNLTPENAPPMIEPMAPTPFSRRQFLAMSASIGFAGVVAACGGSPSNTTQPTGTLQIVKRFPDAGLVKGKVRLPISLGDTSGVLGSESKVTLPNELHASVIDAETGDVVIDKLTAKKFGEGLSVPYWPFVFTIDRESGIFLLKVEEAPESDCSFQIEKRENVLAPVMGEALPPFDTPTTDNNRGVNPICTRTDGMCPFHDITLTDALKSGKPVLYLIGTPAYCQTGTCTPALDALIDAQKTLGDSVVFVHADVYKDKTATEAAPAVKAYKLTYEPVLYITDNKGVLVERLDAVFDVKEMQAVLSAAGIS